VKSIYSVVILIAVLIVVVSGYASGNSDLPLQEILASEVLYKIKNGLPVEYENVIIRGDLDLSELGLQTRQYRLTDESGNPGDIYYVYIVDSPIMIENSKISGNLFLQDCIFQGSFSIWNTTINGTTIFYNSEFSQIASFTGSYFDKDSNFNGAIFRHDASFGEVEFNSGAEFTDALFEGYADFSSTTFNGFADFGNARFLRNDESSEEVMPLMPTTTGPIIIRGTPTSDEAGMSEKYIRFSKARFNGNAYFNEVDFDRDVYFNEAQFKGIADFGGSRFYNFANFNKSTYDKYAYFSNCIFEKEAYFSNIQFNEDALFKLVMFKDKLHLDMSKYNLLYIRWNSINKFVFDDTAYLLLIENFRKLGFYSDADKCYVSYRNENRQNLPIYYRPIDWMLWVLYGYGTMPELALIWSLIVITLCGGFFYFTTNIETTDKKTTIQEALYLSATAFTSGARTLGGFISAPEDITIKGNARYVIAAEKLL